MSLQRVLRHEVLPGLFTAFLTCFTGTGISAASPPSPPAATRAASPSRLPVFFEANRGQASREVLFLSRGGGRALFLTGTESVLALTPVAGEGMKASPAPTVVRMRWAGARIPARMAGTDALRGRAHYLIGSDPSRWRRNVPLYAGVKYESVYPGVDLAFHGRNGHLEYDFIVRPRANPEQVRLRFEGADPLKLDAKGNLVLKSGTVSVIQGKPRVYQVIDGKQRPVAGRFEVRGRNEAGFRVGRYDVTRPLVIDPPVIWFSSTFGGSGFDEGNGVAVEPDGTTYVVGTTASPNLPVTANAFDRTYNFQNDAFVMKLGKTTDATQTPAVRYVTYLGGGGADDGRGISIGKDSIGLATAVVAGATGSPDFPRQNASQPAFGGGPGEFPSDAYVTQLTADGSGLLFSTFYGGSGNDIGAGVGANASGIVFLTGQTGSANLKVLAASQPAFGGGGSDAFVAKFDPKLGAGALVWATFLGGGGADTANALAIDPINGGPNVTGITSSANFPTTSNAFQRTDPDLFVNPLTGQVSNQPDAFVVKYLSPTSSRFYSSYLGGSGFDMGTGIAASKLGRMYVTGVTGSGNFPRKFSVDGTLAGNEAFVTRIDGGASGAASLVWSTFLGGAGTDDAGAAVAVFQESATNPTDKVWVTGRTNSPSDFPKFDANQSILRGTQDAFVTELEFIPAIEGQQLFLDYSSYYGNTGADAGKGIAVDSFGRPYIAGGTTSNPFVQVRPVQSAYGGGSSDAFIVKLGSVVPVTSPGAKVTGGGLIDTAGGPGRFEISVKADSKGSVKGSLEFVVRNQGLTVRSTQVTAIKQTGAMAVIYGRAMLNRDGPFNFVLTVEDKGEPGRRDTFRLELSNGYVAEGTLRAGNLQVH